MVKLRIVKPATPNAFAHTNRMGDTFYLHEGRTKTGKPRYFFAKTVGDGALAEMPDGFEVSESINAVVSVRRKRAAQRQVPAADVELVRAAVKQHRHLRDHDVSVVGPAIVVFEPDTSRALLEQIAVDLGRPLPESYVQERIRRVRFRPVMKFEPDPDGYAIFRMTYSGRGGWSYPLASGKLPELVRQFVRHIGTDAFFELF
ncbi:MAG: hypothetical protein HY744_15955 [Deltaproteobacteria bacterium]|nr:hypothetical protein [Deltaproteobacteria bacterium]